MIKNIKSQIFMLDLIFSFIVLIVSFGLAMSYFSNTSSNIDIYDLNNEIMNSFTLTELNSLNGQEIRDFFSSGYIRNYHNTVAQQAGEFYYLNRDDLAQNLSEFFVKDYIKKQFNFNITLSNGTTTVSLYDEVNNGISLENASLVSVTKRSIYGFIDLTRSYGPYDFKVVIWQ